MPGRRGEAGGTGGMGGGMAAAFCVSGGNVVGMAFGTISSVWQEGQLSF